jgi:hypothetical protein
MYHAHPLVAGISFLLAVARHVTCSKDEASTSVIPVADGDVLGPLCELDRGIGDEVAHENVDVEFWYAVGTSGPLTTLNLFKLEQVLYTSIEEATLWCTQIPPFNVVEGNRVLSEEIPRLGVLTVTPGLPDVPTECKYMLVAQLPWIQANVRSCNLTRLISGLHYRRVSKRQEERVPGHWGDAMHCSSRRNVRPFSAER